MLIKSHMINSPLSFPSFTKLPSSSPHLLIHEHDYARILDFCGSRKALLQGQQIHTHIIKSHYVQHSVFLNTKLVSMYGLCGSLLDAETVFDKMSERTIFTWNSIIASYVSNGKPLGALEMYREMRNSGVSFDSYTFSYLLKACATLGLVRFGAEIHGLAIKFGYDSVVFVANALVSMYAKCDDLDRAWRLFNGMDWRDDVVSWNSMISAYSGSGRCIEALGLFREMNKAGVATSSYSLVAALQACEDSTFAKLGMEIHAFILKSRGFSDVYVANALIAMYLRFCKMAEAAVLFDMFDVKDIVTWNSMLTGCIQNGLYDEALHFFRDLQESGLQPDQISLLSILAATGRLGNLLNGKEIHAYAIKNGFSSSVELGNTLVDLYAKCCNIIYAGRVFNKIPNKDFISWTTVIAGYAQNDSHMEAIELLRKVQMEGMTVDAVMMGSILLLCKRLKCVAQVKEIHGYSIRRGLSDRVLRNTIVGVYGECGNVNYAARLFESIEVKDLVSWTSMISLYVHNGQANEAIEVFYSMKETDVGFDSVTLISILSAVASLSILKKGKEIHGYILRNSFLLEGSLSNALLDMYAHCGSLESASKIFTCTEIRSLISWTAMINAYGMHGLGELAIELFGKLEDQGLIPDHITFLALLYACSHSGLVDEGKRILKTMKHKYHLEPWLEHYTCLVDLLGRKNRIEEAYEYVKSMEIEPPAEVWCALLGACQVHSNKKIGEIAAKKLLELDINNNPGNYVLISNVFASGSRWKDVERVRLRMKGCGLKKNPGCSWIEVGNKVHSFVARDKCHPESHRIYRKLAEITERLEKGGYVAETKFVLHNIEEEKKMEVLYGHSERLAIAYGLMGTCEGSPIRITKNLRICGDCHTFCRLVSELYHRKLIVRDATRFHHFEHGACSCGDFW
ncbi:Tetratricopeptide repeat (TPR)-like superfamily protein [Euphorbia peplus]|nr:Tetratricopeptide repeat (TPR)-like superfamily protein [Euphorbia peplus]